MCIRTCVAERANALPTTESMRKDTMIRIPQWGLLPLSLFLVAPLLLFSQNPPQSNLQAISLAQQAMTTMTQGVTVQDITLTGTVTRSLGSESESGTATLRALGTGESRIDLMMTAGARTEIRDNSTGTPQGKWILPDGTSGPYAAYNCWTDADWFFPLLGSLAGPNIVLSYIGAETRNAVAVPSRTRLCRMG